MDPYSFDMDPDPAENLNSDFDTDPLTDSAVWFTLPEKVLGSGSIFQIRIRILNTDPDPEGR